MLGAHLVYENSCESISTMDEIVAAQARGSWHPSPQLRVLHIAEIASNICKELDPQTLARLARTCKTLNEPAIQELWRDLPNLGPLVKCFPPHVWAVRSKKLSIAALPRLEDWASFLKFSSLVQGLGHADSCTGEINELQLHENVIKTLCSLRPRLILLPNLRSISWHGMRRYKTSWLPSILSIVGNQLETMDFGHWSSDNDPNNVNLQLSLAYLNARRHSLQTLRLEQSIPDPDECMAHTSRSLSSLTCEMFSLTTFECKTFPLPYKAILHLAKLDTLRNATMRFSDAEWANSCSTPLSFRGLVSAIFIVEAEPYIAFAGVMDLPQVTQLELRLLDTPQRLRAIRLFEALRRQCFCNRLRSLTICMDVPGESLENANDSQTVIRSAHIRTLLDFHLMEKFSLDLECHHAFDDDELYFDLAKAWPQLNTLSLACELHCKHDAFPSLLAITHMATYAKNLVELRLNFDASSWAEGIGAEELCSSMVDVPEHYYGRLAHRASTSRLNVLDVDDSPIRCPIIVAVFLSRLFPNLVDELHDAEYCQEWGQWNEVRSFLPVLVRVRQNVQRLVIGQQQQPEEDGNGLESRDGMTQSMVTLIGDETY